MTTNIISKEKKQELLEYMLCNQSLEKSLQNWKKHKKNTDSIIDLINALADGARSDKGIIVAVNCPDIPKGAEHVDFFMADKKRNMYWVDDKNGMRYVMVFTSKERFQECNDISGIVVFMDELFVMIEKRKDLDGIIINLEREEVILNKVILRAVIQVMKMGNN